MPCIAFVAVALIALLPVSQCQILENLLARRPVASALAGAADNTTSSTPVAPGVASALTRLGICPISPLSKTLNFSSIAANCDYTDADFCSKCLCATVDTYQAAFVLANVTVTPGAPIDAATIKKTSDLIGACTRDYYAPLLVAGANLTTLISLQTCNFTTPPLCLFNPNAVQAPAGGAAFSFQTVAPASGNASLSVIPVGTARTYGDVLNALLSSANVTAALSPTAYTAIGTLATNATLAAMPLAADISAALASGTQQDVSSLVTALGGVDPMSPPTAAAPAPDVQAAAGPPDAPEGYMADFTGAYPALDEPVINDTMPSMPPNATAADGAADTSSPPDAPAGPDASNPDATSPAPVDTPAPAADPAASSPAGEVPPAAASPNPAAPADSPAVSPAPADAPAAAPAPAPIGAGAAPGPQAAKALLLTIAALGLACVFA